MTEPKIHGLRPYGEMTQKAHDAIVAIIDKSNPHTSYNAMTKNGIGLRYAYQEFEQGAKPTVYLEQYNEHTGERIGSQPPATGKGPGKITILLFGQLDGQKARLSPARMCAYAVVTNARTIHIHAPLIPTGHTKFDSTYTNTAEHYAKLHKLFNEDLVKFLGTHRTKTGQVVGRRLFPGEYDDVAKECEEKGVTDQDAIDAAFAKALEKIHASKSNTTLREFNVFNAKCDYLNVRWNDVNDTPKKTVTPSDALILDEWTAMYKGDDEQASNISLFLTQFSRQPTSDCIAHIDKWLLSVAYDPDKSELVQAIKSVVISGNPSLPDDIQKALQAWNDACTPNTDELTAIETIRETLLAATDPKNKAKMGKGPSRPRSIGFCSFMANKTPITHQSACEIPPDMAPVMITLNIGALNYVTIAGKPQLSINSELKGITFFRQGKHADGITPVDADNIFDDDENSSAAASKPQVHVKPPSPPPLLPPHMESDCVVSRPQPPLSPDMFDDSTPLPQRTMSAPAKHALADDDNDGIEDPAPKKKTKKSLAK